MIAELPQNASQQPPMSEKQGLKPSVKSSKLTITDMEAVCNLIVTRRLNETEAAAQLGIKQSQWFKFKQRKQFQKQYDLIVARIRGAQINNCLESIDRAGDSFEWESNGKTYAKPGDWRAKAWIAERVLAPERFAQQTNQTTINQTAVSITFGGESEMARFVQMFADEAKRLKELAPAQQTAHLPEPAQDKAIDV